MIKNVIDISKNQGVIDWDKLKTAHANGQLDGVMIRCSAGHDKTKAHPDPGTDTQFLRNIRECNRVGIPCGVYVMSYPLNDEDARLEAEYCLKLIKPYRIELPVAWDFEYDSVDRAAEKGVIVTKAMATRWAYIFLETIEKAGYWASLYCNMDYLSRYFAEGIHNRFDIWLASWLQNETLPESKMPAYNRKLRYGEGLWQYGKMNKPYPGINGDVDVNYAYKDYPTLIKQLGLNHLDRMTYAELAAFMKERGVNADPADGDQTATKADLWEALYKFNN